MPARIPSPRVVLARVVVPAALLVTLAGAFADEPPRAAPAVDPAPAKADGAREAHVSFELFGQHSFQSKLSEDNGKLAVTTAGATLGVTFPVMDRSQVMLGMGAEYRWYDFKDAFKFAPLGGRTPGKPWDNTEQSDATLLFSHQFDEQWAGFVGGGIDSSREVGADFGESLTYGGIVGGTYTFNDKFKLGATFTLRSRLEDSVLAFPFPIIDWRFAERWRLTTDRKVHRAGLNLIYAASDEWTFTLSGGVQSGEFRLVDDGVQPSGVGRDWRVPVVVEASWRVTPHVEVAAFVGSEVWGQVTLDNNNGDRVFQSDLDPTLLVGASATLRW